MLKRVRGLRAPAGSSVGAKRRSPGSSAPRLALDKRDTEMLIVSESKKLTCSSAIGYVVQTVLNRVISVLPKNVVCYPTGIGYDAEL